MNMHMSLTPTQLKLYEERKERQKRIALAAKKLKESKEKPKLTLVSNVSEYQEKNSDDNNIEASEVNFVEIHQEEEKIDIYGILATFSISLQKKLTFGDEYSPYAGCMEEVPREKTMKEISLEVLRKYKDVSLNDIKGPSRQRYIAIARHHAVYSIKKQRPDISYPQIGKFMGGRDHTTAINSYQRFEEMLKAGIVEY